MIASTTNKTIKNTTGTFRTLVSAVVAMGNIRNRVCSIQIRTKVARGRWQLARKARGQKTLTPWGDWGTTESPGEEVAC